MRKRLTIPVVLLTAVLCCTVHFAMGGTAARPRVEHGGILTMPRSGQGSIRFVNVGDCVRMDVVKQTAESMRQFISADIAGTTSSEPFSPATAEAQRAKLGATEAIFLVDDKTLPMTLLAPETGWGVVNAAPLKVDNPDAKKLGNRLQRLMWRVFAQLNGAANTMFPHCALKSVHSLKDLDALDANMICPEPYNKIVADLRHRGITPLMFATYRQACKEGWAPVPTNDVQKAIWDKVRAEIERGPSKPITIPPPKK